MPRFTIRCNHIETGEQVARAIEIIRKDAAVLRSNWNDELEESEFYIEAKLPRQNLIEKLNRSEIKFI